ncbi:40S ribosomal protein S6, partial [Durusdinium trenchii]
MFLLAWLLFLGADAQTCLPDAIPREQRQNISMNGVSMPIGITFGDWDSAKVMGEVYGILTSEVLGYHTQKQLRAGSSDNLHCLGGCPVTAGLLENCTWPPLCHVALENWEGSFASTSWLQKEEALGERRPKNLGSLGYLGIDGLYVLGIARRKSRADTGIHMSYYGNLNASWFHPEKYAANISEVDLNDLATCADGVDLGYPLTAEIYLAITGDSLGVRTDPASGRIMMNCWQEKWFLSAACRDVPSSCIAVVTAGQGWGIREMSQQAFFHNMPLAFATAADYATYLRINKDLQSMAYWWSPDSSFVLYEPALVELPPYSKSEYKQNLFQSQNEASVLATHVAAGFDLAADRAYGLARNVRISDSDMQALLLILAQTAASDYWGTACTWLQANRNFWAEWIPDKTVCSIGKGLVNLQGDFVMSRADAVDCAICPAGRTSLKSMETRICRPCAPGSFQNTFGSSECRLCELGTIAQADGATRCEPCGLGEYANSSGMSSCYRCGSGSGQESWWTTSQEVTSEGKLVVIQLQGATSQSFCRCDRGSFLWQGRCEECSEGSSCPGANRLELLPGYFSKPSAPLEVYNCFDQRICPGGPPGTCAANRDESGFACVNCKEGFREGSDRQCELCTDGDFFFFALVIVLLLGAVAFLYLMLLYESISKQPSSMLVIASGFQQLITMVQILSVLRRFEIDWREPFASILVFLEVLSVDLDMLSISCVATLSSVALFSFRALLIPLLMLVALIVHLCYLCWSRSRNFRWSNLLRTAGSIFLIFFIVLFSMLLAPFQCNSHPNGAYTVKRYKTVFCDGESEHVTMFVIGGFSCLMPIFFLAVCTWIVTVELPRRVARSDAQFLSSCSFLTKRFRPGMEIASVFFLIRNALVVMCPLVTSTPGQLLMMSIILYINLTLVAYYKPWRFTICNWLDNFLLGGMLVILDMGSISVKDSDPQVTILVVMLFLSMMIASILGTMGLGMYRYFQQKYQKQFRYFLCHQKNATGSMARLLKMELELRLPKTKTFIDCDDLNDLTRLFSYVGQDTETFLVLCSPAILTRKWCVGEMVTARANGVHTLLLTWPQFIKPDENFIENYPRIVPDINELTKYGISMEDVAETFRWLNERDCQTMPENITPTTSHAMVSDLVAASRTSGGRKSRPLRGPSHFTELTTNFPVLVDPQDTEAMATALVLLSLPLGSAGSAAAMAGSWIDPNL